MDEFIRSLVARSGPDGKLDEHAFIVEQSRLPFEERARLRRSPELATLCFGIEVPTGTQVSSFYFDNTTLCMRRPLLEHVSDGMRVLEIGPGPSATLSLFLLKTRRDLRVFCAEVNPDFVRSAREIAVANHLEVEILESDMTSAVKGRTFDVVLMNPPYVKDSVASALKVERASSEGRGTYAGESGCEILERFVDEVPAVLAPGGVALLGINNWHLEDEAIAARIGPSRLKLSRRFYPPERVAPHGPYSQVYVLRPATP